ncbi:alpha/beta hydrolase [Streptosporangium sp. CA-135522]|uniref:alpha/beta hydrolase n=1 Tax=Streptosporangium sp. CA-135522 TaxID=3240072 RepID=UPI003D911B05
MPIGYLVPVALVAWCTVFALAPLRRPRFLGAMSFRSGLVLNELPFLAFGWLLVSTLSTLGQGDIDAPGGWATVGLAVLTTAGLVVVARRGLLAGPVVDRALAEGLGNGWRAAVDPDMAVRLRRRLPLARILFRPFFVRRRDVERLANIGYGDAGKRNLLDVYRRRSRPSDGPTLIHLHGGEYVSGRKNSQALPLIYRLASQGWVCVSANYRLRPAAQFPDHLIDLKKVIAWVREHGHDYGADPSVIFVAGSSSGGHLASIAALTPNDPAFQPGFEHADTTVTAAISLNGYYGNYYGQGSASSPLAYSRPDAPPFFIAHGDRDTMVLVENARLFAEKLRSTSSNPVVYAELPGAQHSFDLFHSLRFEAVVDAVEAFAAWVRTREKARKT